MDLDLSGLKNLRCFYLVFLFLIMKTTHKHFVLISKVCIAVKTKVCILFLKKTKVCWKQRT